MTINYEDSYLGQLRKLVGKQKVFVITARAIIQDSVGRVLFVRRKDNGSWVMPAGSMELGESIMDCVKREVKEESGLEVISAVPIAIYSDPRFSFVTAYGDPYQPLSIVFLVKEWRGQLQATTDETLDARFYSLKELPPNLPAVYHETLEDLLRYGGQIIVK
jgi:ADP-ribose pyrophosphatase YjhB (NUDIX family)